VGKRQALPQAQGNDGAGKTGNFTVYRRLASAAMLLSIAAIIPISQSTVTAFRPLGAAP
jgi:hypothetical protein